MSMISLSSPAMSDKALLLSVEDLISLAMGPIERNTVNFKMIQTVLHILARQMRMLEQKVVLVVGSMPGERPQPPPPTRQRRRSERRSRDGEQLYRRGTPPEFKSEEERIAWEKQQDELEEKSRARSGSRRRMKSSLNIDKEVDGYDRRRASGRDDRPGGPRRSGAGHDQYDDERGARAKPGGRGRVDSDRTSRRGRHGEDERRRYDEESGIAGFEGRDGGGRRRSRGGRYSDEDEGGRGGRGRSVGRGGRDRDAEEDERGRGRSQRRGGRDKDEEGDEGGRGRSQRRGGRDKDEEGDERSRGRYRGRAGRDGDEDDEGVRSRSRGRGGRDGDEEGYEGGRHKWRGRGGRDSDAEDAEGGRGRLKGRGNRHGDEEGGEGGRGKLKARGGRDGDEEGDEGGRGKLRGRGSRGRDAEDDEEGGHKSRGRGGRDRDAEYDEEGRGRSRVRGSRDGDEEDAEGGRGRLKGRGSRDGDEEGGKGGRGKLKARGGRDGDEEGDEGGRGKLRGRGSRGRDAEDDEEGGHKSRGRGGRDRDAEYDEEGRGRSRGRGGRDRDEEDDEEGRGRSRGRGGRDRDEEDDEEGRGRSRGRGGRDRDEEDDEEGRGRSRGRGGRGRDEEDDEEVRGRSRGRGGRDRDEEDDEEVRGRSRGRGGRDRDEDDDEEGRGRSRGRGGRDGYEEEGDEEGRRGSRRRGGRDWDGEDDERDRGRSRARGDKDRDGDGGKDRTGKRGGEDERSSEGEERGRRDRERDGRRIDGERDGRGRDDAAERGAKQGIGVREIQGPENEKLLVVEKGPTTIGSRRDRESIAVVTQSQFQLLEAQVEELMRTAGPLPELAMPDNKQLRRDLAAGASLTDAMQAMQVSARVQAAEQAIMKLGGLLTHLAVSGALPPDAAGAVMAGGWADEDEVLIKSTNLGTPPYQSVRVGPSGKDVPGHGQAGKTPPGATGAPSKDDAPAAGKFVTKPEMGLALTKFRDEVTKSLQGQIDKAATSAENAVRTAKTLGEKVDELLKMDVQLTTLHSMVEDYTEQLIGFDAGLTTQMASFKEQMAHIRAELQAGLQQLEISNSNPETAAVMELNGRFEDLVRGLDETLLQHTALSNMQHQLTLELKSLVEGVEMLREQKADRDELLDILRDKADVNMLEGLVRQEEFERAQAHLEQRVDQCNDKFKRQDEVWMDAMRDLRELMDTKAQLTELLKLRDEATAQLQSIDERINRLALILGEPKAALLMRKLARDGSCAACLTPAMMPPGAAAAPPALPAARAPAAPEPEPEPRAADYPDFRTHKCHRWVGGSHTLLPAGRARAAPLDLPDVTRKYAGYGADGRLYWMESPMEACVECNPEPTPAPPGTARTDGGAGAGAGGDAAPADCAC